jgi:hypothetical protein
MRLFYAGMFGWVVENGTRRQADGRSFPRRGNLVGVGVRQKCPSSLFLRKWTLPPSGGSRMVMTMSNAMLETPETSADFGRLLLTHVELCYAVALELTRDSRRAEDLARETLLWAWKNQWGLSDAAAIRMFLLRELRGRFLNSRHKSPHPRFFGAQPALEVKT